MSVLLVWAQFLACLVAIAWAGPRLIRYADVIARLAGLSRSWVGVILLATATSLPELFAGVSAVTVAGAPDIAVGDALGSCVFNLLMLVALDASSRKQSIYTRVQQVHLLSAGFMILLLAFVGALIIAARGGLDFRVFHVSLFTPIIVALYIVAIRSIYAYEIRVPLVDAGVRERPCISLAAAVWRYAGAAAVVAAAGLWLPVVGTEIAYLMGWRESFVGTLFVAAATSVPELVVTLNAVRLEAIDMAIGNLLGSNLFDILILAIDDLAYLGGSLFAAVSPTHAVTAFTALAMSGILVVALVFQPSRRLGGTIGWAGLSLIVAYLLGAYAVFIHVP